MAKYINLLLNTNVENLGIVGDVVKVRPGYARNYLLPHGLAEVPTKKRIEDLQEERKRVQAELAALRSERQKMLEKLEDFELKLVRSTNDQGLLYGSVTQSDVSDALKAEGHNVDTRFIRLGQAFKRVGTYHVPIQFAKDLRTEITVVVASDRPLGEGRADFDFAEDADAEEAAVTEAPATESETA